MSLYAVYCYVDPRSNQCLYVGSTNNKYRLFAWARHASYFLGKEMRDHLRGLVDQGVAKNRIVRVIVMGLDEDAARRREILEITRRRPLYNILHNPNPYAKNRQYELKRQRRAPHVNHQ